MQSCLLLIVVMLPVVSQDGESVGDAVGGVLHLQLHGVLSIIHLFLILALLDCEDALLGVRLLRVD